MSSALLLLFSDSRIHRRFEIWIFQSTLEFSTLASIQFRSATVIFNDFFVFPSFFLFPKAFLEFPYKILVKITLFPQVPQKKKIYKKFQFIFELNIRIHSSVPTERHPLQVLSQLF